MCGIAGFCYKGSELICPELLLKRMTDIMAHRGPDAEGQWSDGKVALGHRRLSIIELSSESNQPMVSIDGRFVLIFNGEIYNYIELKEELKQKGNTFKTNSDSEVIIEAYRSWGVDCFNRFNGMWALALYDKESQILILSRDRFGVKPLYYVHNDKHLVFASEMKAILAAFPEYRVRNNACISRYLMCSRNENSDSETFFKDIMSFPSAKYAVFSLVDNRMDFSDYWKVEYEIFYEKWIKGKNPYKTFRGLFENAILIRLRADVEVGACLSGGIDSSAIVGCASKKYGKRMHTFSSVYADEECNEEYYIKKVNEKWQTIPHYVWPDHDEKNLARFIKEITYYHEQPSNGASLYSQYKVMEEASKNVKVLLDGQGADELFAGYVLYYAYLVNELCQKNTFFSRFQALTIIGIICAIWPEVMASINTEYLVAILGLKNSLKFLNKSSVSNLRLKRTYSMFTEEFKDATGIIEEKQRIIPDCKSLLNNKLCSDVLYDSLPSLLHNEDGNSMAFSIETRVPFLDYRIVEFALALNDNYKIRSQWTKWLVRKSLKDYYPKEVFKRKNKMGFPAPFGKWLKEGTVKEELKEVIMSFAERKIVPKTTIEKYYEAHINNECDNNAILFRFYSMEIWLRMVDNHEI